MSEPNEQTTGKTGDVVKYAGDYAAQSCCRAVKRLAASATFPRCDTHGEATWGWIPPLDFPGLARVMSRAALFVAGDTGPVHLADAVGAPALALFGPDAYRRNVPLRNGPYRGAALGYDQTASVETVARKAVALVKQAGEFHDR